MSEGKQPFDRRQWVLAAVAEHEGRLVRYALRLVRDEEAARDAVQHAFLRLCDQRPETLRGGVAPWLFTVCRNKALDLAKAAARAESLDAPCHRNGHAEEDETPSYAAALIGREPDPADAAESGELIAILRRLVDELPAAQREMIDLWAEGFSGPEISQITGKSEGNVRVLIHRGVTRLRGVVTEKLGAER
jgi:RNA polymerase sigma-70 factor (ECF subfamily)